MFICWQKINFILRVFHEILQRCCILVILGTLRMPRYVHLKYNYQPVESFPVCKHAKNQLHPARFHGDIAKIYKLLILGTLGMPA